MRARLRVTGVADTDDDVRSLGDWLSRDEEFRGRVDIAHRDPGDGELGAMQDVVVVTLTAGGITALANTVAVWLRTRRSELSVKGTEADGSGFEITAKGPTATKLAKKLDLDD